MKSNQNLKNLVNSSGITLLFSVFLSLFSCNHGKTPSANQTSNTGQQGIDTVLYLYVGTYTKPANPGEENSKGIYVLKLNTQTGILSQVAASPATSNPSYLCLRPGGKYLYAVNENSGKGSSDFGGLTSIKIDSFTHNLQIINSVSSMGKDPCYVSLDPTSNFAMVANYSSGVVSLFPINADGSLKDASMIVQDQGKGPNVTRQEGPHAHMISPDATGKYIYATDLGTDKLTCYTLDSGKKQLINTGHTTSLTAGAGPRHIAFHSMHPWIYIVNELNGTIEAFKQDTATGALTRFQIISTLPAGTTIPAASADIHISPSGKYLYASNRDGNNNIAMYLINETTGELTLIGHQSTKGKIPRNFAIDKTGSFLLVANQESNNIVVFRIDNTTGKLIDNNTEIKIPMPVCIKFEM